MDTGPGLPITAVHSVAGGLPSLARLTLHLSDEGLDPIRLASRVLTSLTIRGGGATRVTYPPPSLPTALLPALPISSLRGAHQPHSLRGRGK